VSASWADFFTKKEPMGPWNRWKQAAQVKRVWPTDLLLSHPPFIHSLQSLPPIKPAASPPAPRLLLPRWQPPAPEPRPSPRPLHPPPSLRRRSPSGKLLLRSSPLVRVSCRASIFNSRVSYMLPGRRRPASSGPRGGPPSMYAASVARRLPIHVLPCPSHALFCLILLSESYI
jgi:hypothetical protein